MSTTDTATSALIGELSITASTGVTLAAATDIGLAWLWAPVELEVRDGIGAWAALTYGEQCGYVADALAELRRAYAAGAGE